MANKREARPPRSWEVGKKYPTRAGGHAIFLGSFDKNPIAGATHAFAFMAKGAAVYALYWYKPDGIYPSSGSPAMDILSDDPTDAELAVLDKMRHCGILNEDCDNRDAVAVLREIKDL